jgi:hypothetical protein
MDMPRFPYHDFNVCMIRAHFQSTVLFFAEVVERDKVTVGVKSDKPPHPQILSSSGMIRMSWLLTIELVNSFMEHHPHPVNW